MKFIILFILLLKIIKSSNIKNLFPNQDILKYKEKSEHKLCKNQFFQNNPTNNITEKINNSTLTHKFSLSQKQNNSKVN